MAAGGGINLHWSHVQSLAVEVIQDETHLLLLGDDAHLLTVSFRRHSPGLPPLIIRCIDDMEGCLHIGNWEPPDWADTILRPLIVKQSPAERERERGEHNTHTHHTHNTHTHTHHTHHTHTPHTHTHTHWHTQRQFYRPDTFTQHFASVCH